MAIETKHPAENFLSSDLFAGLRNLYHRACEIDQFDRYVPKSQS